MVHRILNETGKKLLVMEWCACWAVGTSLKGETAAGLAGRECPENWGKNAGLQDFLEKDGAHHARRSRRN